MNQAIDQLLREWKALGGVRTRTCSSAASADLAQHDIAIGHAFSGLQVGGGDALVVSANASQPGAAPIVQGDESFVLAPDFSDLANRLTERTLCVSDATAENICTLVCMLNLRAGSPIPQSVFVPFLRAAAVWRMDGNISVRPESSWVALHNAGAHALFEESPGDGSGSDYSRAWYMGVQFLLACIQQGIAPGAMPEKPISAEHTSCKAALLRERDIYQSMLKHSRQVQLRLPLVDAPSRFRLVDALFYEDSDVLGAAKAFYRNDTENAPLKRGYEVAFTYRRDGAPGNRFVLACDPKSGITLKPIWESLEAAESQAWMKLGSLRPTDAPRKLAGVDANQYNEPWWNNHGRFDFLSEPKPTQLEGLSPNLSKGSALSWEDLKETVWFAANPIRPIRVKPVELASSGISCGPEQSLWDVADTLPRTQASGKRLVCLQWSGAVNQDMLVMAAPCGSQFLASLTFAQPGQAHAIASDLVDTSQFERIELEGGSGIVTRDGVVLFDDWRDDSLDFEVLVPMVNALIAKQNDLMDLRDNMTALQDRFSSLVNPESKLYGRWTGRKMSGDLDDILAEAAELEVKVNQVDRNYAARMSKLDAGARTTGSVSRLYDAIDKAWGLSQQLEKYTDVTERVIDNVRKLRDTRSFALQKLVFHFGFSMTAAAIISEPTGKLLGAALRRLVPAEVCGSSLCQFMLAESDNWLQIISAALITLLLFSLVSFFSNRSLRGSLSEFKKPSKGD